MPFDSKKKIYHNGKTYYFNNETKKIYEVSIIEMEIKNCPADILCELLSLLDEQFSEENK